nr:MAG: 25.6 kDa tombusvirus replication protein [Plant tombusvirus-like associated RNA 3]
MTFTWQSALGAVISPLGPAVSVCGITASALLKGAARRGKSYGIPVAVGVGLCLATQYALEVRKARRCSELCEETDRELIDAVGPTAEEEENITFNLALDGIESLGSSGREDKEALALKDGLCKVRDSPAKWTRRRVRGARLRARKSEVISLVRDVVKCEMGLPRHTEANSLVIRSIARRELETRNVRRSEMARLLPLIEAAVFLPYDEEVEARSLSSCVYARYRRWRAGCSPDTPR